MICKVNGCEYPVAIQSSGYCWTHYLYSRQGKELAALRPREREFRDANGKVCNTCKTYKPYSEYYKNRPESKKVRGRCKECDKDAQRAYRERLKNGPVIKESELRVQNKASI